MSPESHLLLIPVSGLIEVIHSDVHQNIDTLFHGRDAEGAYLTLNLMIDNENRGTVHWCTNQTGPMNPRAREAMLVVSGVHMIFTGPVVFEGLPNAKVFELVSALSREE